MDRKPYPPELRQLIYEQMDFGQAFASLKGFTHFYSEALRGFLCRLMNDLAESWKHLRRAERLFAGKSVKDEEDERYFFNLRLFFTATAILCEAAGSGSARQTDAEMVRFSELEKPISREHDRTRIMQISYYNLIRGDYETAHKTFEFLLEQEGLGFREGRVAVYCGAAAAARELGHVEIAEKHYESAVLGVSMLDVPFRVATYAGRLHVLATHWGRESDARRWLEMIEELRCPQTSKEHFLRCAKWFVRASRAENRIFMA